MRSGSREKLSLINGWTPTPLSTTPKNKLRNRRAKDRRNNRTKRERANTVSSRSYGDMYENRSNFFCCIIDRGESRHKLTRPSPGQQLRKVVNFVEFCWIYLNFVEFCWIYLNFLEFRWICSFRETPDRDGPTDRRTDPRTEKASYGVAIRN